MTIDEIERMTAIPGPCETTADQSKIRRTRFHELGYTCDGPRLWRICDMTDGRASRIGQHYPTKTALLADLERYASQYGCDGAQHVETSIEPRATAPDHTASMDDFLAFRAWTKSPSFMEDDRPWKCAGAFQFLGGCLNYIAGLQDVGIDCVFQSPADTRAILATDKRMVFKPEPVAPELLSALQEIVRNTELWAKCDNMAGRLCGIARSAIAKAEGSAGQ